MDKETITYLIALIGCMIGIYSWYKSNKKDSQEETSQFVKVNMKLDNLCDNTNAMKGSLEKMSESISAIQQKQLEHEFRIKELEKKLGE